MIAVKFKGRLGNQLFQYAFVYATAKRLNTKFYADTSSERNFLKKYFLLKFHPLHLIDTYFFEIKGLNHLFGGILKRGFYKTLIKLYNLQPVEISSDNCPTIELKKIKNQALYNGYYQSNAYFSDYGDTIKKRFIVRRKYVKDFNSVVSDLPRHEKLITVHVRRGDYLTLQANLPLQYYHDGIKYLNHPGDLFVIISDDPDFVEREFKHLENKYISRNEEIIDLQFLMHADACILSNSSFSWWGAYLNPKTIKVIAPKNWLGSGNTMWPNSIIQKEWLIYPE